MATKKKMLQAAAGNAAASGGGGAGGLNVEEVFSTYLYTGTAGAATAAVVTNGIDLSGEGGLVWTKQRNGTEQHFLTDTERGGTKYLNSDDNGAQGNQPVITFNSDGFSQAFYPDTSDVASWTFRKAPKFFDVVTYTGNSTARTISHNLGTTVGTILIKKTSAAADWIVYHRSTGATDYLELNTTNAVGTYDMWNNTAPTSTEFSLSSYDKVNQSGATYVAYLFAHNDGDGTFGPTGDQDVIRCGSVTTDGSGNATVDLGFEPQWLMIKSSSSSLSGWHMLDNMRGIATGGTYQNILANSSGAEATAGSNYFEFTADGFKINAYPTGGNTDWIYIAIRRGPMAVPTDATDVFSTNVGTNTTDWTYDAGFPVDTTMYKGTGGSSTFTFSRLIGSKYLTVDNGNAETSFTAGFDNMSHVFVSGSANNGWAIWDWKRAPHFFDTVIYTGDGVAGRTVSHNLGVKPDMMVVKRRNDLEGWQVYHSSLGATKHLEMNHDFAATSSSNRWYSTEPTETEFTVNNIAHVNASGDTYVAHLFASLDGISKFGSFTTTGSDVSVDCGFSNGARFVLIKKTNGSDNWWVWDTTRGITTGSDSRLALNNSSSAATGADNIDPYSSGFTITSGILGGAGNTFIYYAIA